MKNKWGIASLSMIILLFVYIIAMTNMNKQNDYENLLLVFPKLNNVVESDVDKIEQINEDEFLMTYEVIQEEMVKIHNSNYTVALIGTNYTYPYVMNYDFVDGSFFTKSAQKQKHKTVVLNEWAAFEMFGSNNIVGNKIMINDTYYTIAGIIKDGDTEHKNVYIPITFMTKNPNSFIACLSPESGITEEYVRNECKQAGLADTDYNFINLNSIIYKTQKEIIVALLFIACVLLIYVIKISAKKVWILWKALIEYLEQYYFRDLFKNKPIFFYRMILGCLCVIICMVLLGIIAVALFEIYLNFNIYLNILKMFNTDCFINKLYHIKYVSFYSDICFIAFMAVLVVFVERSCRT